MERLISVLLSSAALGLSVLSVVLLSRSLVRRPQLWAPRALALAVSLMVAALYALQLAGVFPGLGLPPQYGRPLVIFLEAVICAYAIAER